MSTLELQAQRIARKKRLSASKQQLLVRIAKGQAHPRDLQHLARLLARRRPFQP